MEISMAIRTPDFTSIVGMVVEEVRLTNVTRWRPASRSPERREVWLRTLSGGEFQYVIHSRSFPARRGHRVMLLLDGMTVLALFNISTSDLVNYTRVEAASTCRWRDQLPAMTLGLGAAFIWDAPPVQMALMGLWAGGAMWVIRLVQRWRLQNRVDDVLASLARDEVDLEGC
jgi:hypothetical protein